LPEKTRKNTFAPTCPRKALTALRMFAFVIHGRIQMSKLPPDAQEAVRGIAREVYSE